MRYNASYIFSDRHLLIAERGLIFMVDTINSGKSDANPINRHGTAETTFYGQNPNSPPDSHTASTSAAEMADELHKAESFLRIIATYPTYGYLVAGYAPTGVAWDCCIDAISKAVNCAYGKTLQQCAAETIALDAVEHIAAMRPAARACGYKNDAIDKIAANIIYTTLHNHMIDVPENELFCVN